MGENPGAPTPWLAPQKVGNLQVHILRPDGRRETATLDSVPDPAGVRDLINRTVHHVRAAEHQRQLTEQQNLNVHRFETTDPVPTQPVAAGPVPSVPGTVVSSPPATPPPPAVNGNSQATEESMTPERAMELLKQLGQLRDAGVVTVEEFEAKKRDLLGRI
jgi:hypothetical protein